MKVNDFSTGIYEHYKGQKYLVLGLAKDAETHKMFVIYVTLYENEEVSLSKASEIAGVCIEEFKESLKDRGLSVKVPPIAKEELDEQTALIVKVSNDNF